MLALKMKKAKTIKPLVARSIETQTTVHLQIYTKSFRDIDYTLQGELEIELVHSLNELRDQVQTKWGKFYEIKMVNKDKTVEMNIHDTVKKEALYFLL